MTRRLFALLFAASLCAIVPAAPVSAATTATSCSAALSAAASPTGTMIGGALPSGFISTFLRFVPTKAGARVVLGNHPGSVLGFEILDGNCKTATINSLLSTPSKSPVEQVGGQLVTPGLTYVVRIYAKTATTSSRSFNVRWQQIGASSNPIQVLDSRAIRVDGSWLGAGEVLYPSTAELYMEPKSVSVRLKGYDSNGAFVDASTWAPVFGRTIRRDETAPYRIKWSAPPSVTRIVTEVKSVGATTKTISKGTNVGATTGLNYVIPTVEFANPNPLMGTKVVIWLTYRDSMRNVMDVSLARPTTSSGTLLFRTTLSKAIVPAQYFGDTPLLTTP